MKLSLIITHYDEPWEIVEPMFQSIEMQLGVDWDDIEVIIAQDGQAKEDFFEGIEKDYPFDVHFYGGKKIGVSAARNMGLEKATGDYVMFCDCDDRFISAYAFHLYMKQMGKYNLIKSPFVEDQVIDGELKLIRHERDITFIHGKAYRREFLLENNLRFNENLTIHEDSFFNVLAGMIAGADQHEMSPAVYLWKYNENSVVRRDREMFIYKTYKNLMDCRIAICKELENRGFIAEYMQAVVKTVIDSYYDFQKPDALNPKNKDLIKSAEKEFARFYSIFNETYKETNVNDIAQMMYLCRANAYINNMRIEQETLSQFLTRVVKEYNIKVTEK